MLAGEEAALSCRRRGESCELVSVDEMGRGSSHLTASISPSVRATAPLPRRGEARQGGKGLEGVKAFEPSWRSRKVNQPKKRPVA